MNIASYLWIALVFTVVGASHWVIDKWACADETKCAADTKASASSALFGHVRLKQSGGFIAML